MPSPTQETKSILEALRESRQEIEAEIREEEIRLDELRARNCDLRAEEYRVAGYPYDEESARAEARWRRDPTLENFQAMHVAHVRASAAYHLRTGIVPADDHVWRDEVEAEMDRQRAEVRQ